MTSEAKLVDGGTGFQPEGDGWFVLNARDVRWFGSPAEGHFTFYEPDEPQWDDFGFNVSVLEPGRPMATYHRESNREVFLVLSGEALLLVEGEERRLRAWDFFHCPPGTEHALIGAGDGPCVVVAAGARSPDAESLYVAAEIARRHGAAPPHDTPDWDEAHPDAPPYSMWRYREGDLPGPSAVSDTPGV